MIITSDWHLTSDPADEYRWEVFRKSGRLLRKYDDRTLVVLGDITDRKDKHSAVLVNRMVDEFAKLARGGIGVVVLIGNHDYIDPRTPFFSFLNEVDDVHVLASPESLAIDGRRCLFVPNAYGVVEELDKQDRHPDVVFMHHTVGGAVTSNGMRLGRLRTNELPKGPLYISGDIHVPQRCGKVVYVGSPHPVHFGDSFRPRMLRLCGTGLVALPLKSIRKHSVTISSVDELGSAGMSEGDQVSVTIKVSRGRARAWHSLKEDIQEWCGASGVRLAGVSVDSTDLYGRRRKRLRRNFEDVDGSPKDIMRRFSKKEELDIDILNVGMNILGGAKGHE